jgi:hypothetical protein
MVLWDNMVVDDVMVFRKAMNTYVNVSDPQRTLLDVTFQEIG